MSALVGYRYVAHSQFKFGFWGGVYLGVSGELSPASVYISLLPVVEACVVVVGVPGR